MHFDRNFSTSGFMKPHHLYHQLYMTSIQIDCRRWHDPNTLYKVYIFSSIILPLIFKLEDVINRQNRTFWEWGRLIDWRYHYDMMVSWFHYVWFVLRRKFPDSLGGATWHKAYQITRNGLFDLSDLSNNKSINQLKVNEQFSPQHRESEQ